MKLLEERKIHNEDLWRMIRLEVELMMKDEVLDLDELSMIVDTYYKILRIYSNH